MKRVAIATAIILIGTLANVGIAMWLAVRAPVSESPTEPGSAVLPSGERVPYLSFRGNGADVIKWHLYLLRGEAPSEAAKYPITGGPWWSDVAARQAYNAPGHPFKVNVRCEMAAGWPMRSMRWCYEVKDPPGTEYFEPRWAGIQLTDFASVPSWHLVRFRAIPVLPAWRGFLVNSAFYSLVVAMVFMVPRVSIRALRRRRGRCVNCGYPAGVSDVCTECGRPLQRPAGS